METSMPTYSSGENVLYDMSVEVDWTQLILY